MKSSNFLRGLIKMTLVLPLVLALAGCREPEILVKTILFEPDEVELFVGDFKRVKVNTFPHFADNESDLDYFMTDKTVAAYDGSTVVGLDEGRSEIIATCGLVEASCPVRVFAWKIMVDGVEYGVSKSDAHMNYRGVTSAGELEIELSHDTGNVLHQFTVWIRTDLLGQRVDFNDPVDGVSVSATCDISKEGYAVSAMNTGNPLVFNADWSDADDVQLVSGYVRVDRKESGNVFTVKADFKLSNGFLFGAEWEGKLPVTF